MAELISAEIGAPITFCKHVQSRLPLSAITAFTKVAGGLRVRRGRDRASTATTFASPSSRSVSWPRWCRGTCRSSSPSARSIPALLAGCTVVVKPSPGVGAGRAAARGVHRAGRTTAGVVNFVPGDRAVGAHLVAHPGVDKVSFTGSTAAGREVALACAAGLRQVSLELGGKSAAIVLEDADPAAGGQGNSDVQPRQQRAGLQCAEPRAGSGRATPKSSTRWRPNWTALVVGDPADRGHPTRTAGGAAPAGPGPGVHRQRHRRRAPAWSLAGPSCPTGSTAVGTCGRRCSPMPTTP